MQDFTTDVDSYFSRLKAILDTISRKEINEVMNLLLQALEEEKQILIMGNGGSAATASHFACDFNKGLSLGKKRRFKFLCLNDNTATLTAYANDLSYEDCFVEPLKNFLNGSDLVIAISGSGNSKNVVKAVEYANAHGGITIGLTGYDGGALKKTAKFGIHIPIADMQITEDLHMVLDHMMYNILGRILQ